MGPNNYRLAQKRLHPWFIENFFFIGSGERINNMLLGSENDLQLGIEQNCTQLVQQNVGVGEQRNVVGRSRLQMVVGFDV